MIVDEDRSSVLKKYATTKGGKKAVESDHNPLYAGFTLLYDAKKPEVRKEVFNFKEKE